MFYGWASTWQNPEFKKWSLIYFLKTIRAPVLAIQGDLDEYGTEAQLDSIVDNVKGYSEKMFIKNCGHIPHFQAKELVLEKMTAFINEHCLK
jgi:pimeloyl-ACP methyl ester carboxylesterase